MFFSNYNYVEIAIIAIFVFFIGKGYLKGFIGEVVSIISMLLAIIGVALAMKIIDSFLKKQASDALLAAIFLVSLVLLMQVFRILIKSLKLFSKIPIINGLNKLLGMIIGIAEGLLITWILFFVITNYNVFNKSAEILEMVEGNKYILLLYKNNMLLKLFLMYKI